MKSLIMFFAVIFALAIAQANQTSILELNTTNIQNSQVEQIEKLVKEADLLIPQIIKNQLKNKIQVSFSHFSKYPLQAPDCTKKVDSFVEAKTVLGIYKNVLTTYKSKSVRYNNSIFAKSDKKQIFLEDDFLQLINTASSFQCEHNNFYELAKASLINSVANIYATQTNINKNLKYLTISGPWKKSKTKQGFWPRSINPYEYTGTPADHYALNLEYYLMDSEYSCRRPLLAEYFKNTLQVDPLAQKRDCAVNTVLRIARQYRYQGQEFARLKTYDLNPDRVYNVYYLRAGAGAGAGSFGHSMFRIDMCPKGWENSKECSRDFEYDLVVNPRANPLELQLDNMKGLFGGYPSQFLITSFPEIRQEYGQQELRHLFNIPLGERTQSGEFTEPMSDLQKRRFIYATLDQYWNYYGSYKFLTNNCSDETMRLYQMTSDDPAVLKLNVLKPFDVNKKLDKRGYIDQSEILPLEAETKILSKIFGGSKGPKNWDDYEQNREQVRNSELTVESRIFEHDNAILSILKLECEFKNQKNCSNILKNPKELRKEVAKWLELATPQKEFEQANKEVTQEEREKILAGTFHQIRSRYEFLIKNARSEEEKNDIVKYFYQLMVHIDNKKASDIGNESIQLAYEIAYPNKDRSVRRNVGESYIVDAKSVELIRNSVDEFTKIQGGLMPFREKSVQPGYGIPLSKEVVRGQEYAELLLKEDVAVENVIESLKIPLGYDYVLFKEIRAFFKELETLRN